LKVDKRSNKFTKGEKLKNFDINKLPDYIQNNLNSFKDWIE